MPLIKSVVSDFARMRARAEGLASESVAYPAASRLLGRLMLERASLATAHLVPTPDRQQFPDHVKKLGIPPAWSDVRVSHDPHAKILAAGRDAAGRDHYVYHPKFVASQAAQKFNRVKKLEKSYDNVVAKNEKNRQHKDPVVREHADALHLIMHTGIRPGSEMGETRGEKTYGASTLEGRHVTHDAGKTHLSFRGKSGKNLHLPVHEHSVHEMLQGRKAQAGENGRLFPNVSRGSLLNYTKTTAGSFKTKDFRTLHGTKIAAHEVSQRSLPTNAKEYKESVKHVAKAVSERLGNTPSVALSSYISPHVFSGWRHSSGSEA